MRICSWCGIKLNRWRRITFRRHCSRCELAITDKYACSSACVRMSRLPSS